MATSKILIEVDQSCEMARVSIDGKGVMEGNFWDFHPGCHGIHEYGEFESYKHLADRIKLTLMENGKQAEIETQTYKYE